MTAITNPRIFSIEHIANFKMLRKLCLYDYHFNWEIQSIGNPVLLIDEVSLHNCTWEYPFKLSQFNYNHSMTKLNISYKNDNPFIRSERFNRFIKNEDKEEDFQSLEVLSINILYDDLHSFFIPADYSYIQRKDICGFINHEKYPNLRQLTFHGWILKLYDFESFPKSISRDDNNLELLDLEIFDTLCSKKVIEDLKKECRLYFPWMELHLVNVIEPLMY